MNSPKLVMAYHFHRRCLIKPVIDRIHYPTTQIITQIKRKERDNNFQLNCIVTDWSPFNDWDTEFYVYSYSPRNVFQPNNSFLEEQSMWMPPFN